MSECKNSNCPCDCDNKALHHELARADGKTEVDPSLCCGIDTSHRLRKQLEAERAKVRRLREALEWSIEESDPSPCPYCGVGGKCLPHRVLAELEGEAMTSDEALMRGRG